MPTTTQLLSQAAKNLGETKKAEDYAHIVRILDPGLESRLEPSHGAGATRADYSATIQSTAGAIGQVVSQIEQIRLMKMCLEMVKHQMTPPPACGTPNNAPGAFPAAGIMPGQPPGFPPQPGMNPLPLDNGLNSPFPPPQLLQAGALPPTPFPPQPMSSQPMPMQPLPQQPAA